MEGCVYCIHGMQRMGNSLLSHSDAQSSVKPPISVRRIHELDGIRGLAALLVAVGHWQAYFMPDPFLKAYPLCVDAFFILSGIVLTHVYEAKILSGEAGMREFWLHRLARLYPLHLFTLVLALVLNFAIDWFCWHGIHTGHPFDILTRTDYFWFRAFINLAMLQGAGFDGYAWDTPSWSISVEVIVNLIWVSLLVRTRRSIPVVALVLLSFLMIVNACGVNIPFPDRGINTFGILNPGVLGGLMGFMIGVLCYRHLVPLLSLIPVLWANIVALAATFVAVAVFHLGDTEPAYGLRGMYYVMVMVVLPLFILSSMHSGTFLNAFFRLKPMLWLGRISYSVYLIHWLILLPFEMAWKDSFIQWNRPVIVTVYLGSVLLLATLTYYFLEAPCRRWINARWKQARAAIV